MADPMELAANFPRLSYQEYLIRRDSLRSIIDDYKNDAGMDAYPEWRNRQIERFEEDQKILADENPEHAQRAVLEEVAKLATERIVEQVQPRQYGLDYVPLNNPQDNTPTRG